MARILVTGAGGFIGHHLVRDLKQEGHFVAGVDIRRPKWAETDADIFYDLDLRDQKNLSIIFDGEKFELKRYKNKDLLVQI